MRKILLVGLFVALASGTAFAGVILLGSDAISFHSSTAIGIPTFSELARGSSRPVLVINNFGLTGSFSSLGGYAGAAGGFFGASSLTGLTLTDFSAIFLASPGGCCSDPSSLIAGSESAVTSYLAAGGNLGIENFMGFFSPADAARYLTILGFDPSAGVINSAMFPGGLDPCIATSAGLAEGYPASLSLAACIHQIYDPAFFTARGYTVLMTDTSVPNRCCNYGAAGSARTGAFLDTAPCHWAGRCLLDRLTVS